MRCTGVLAALALRRALACTPRPVGLDRGDASAEDILARLGAQKNPGALQQSLDRVWLALELFLAGEDLWERIHATLPGREQLFRPLHLLHGGASFDLAELDEPDSRRHCWQALRRAREAGALSDPELDAADLMESLSSDPSADVESVLEGEWQELSRLAEDLKRDGHPGLRSLFLLGWQQREPLVVVLAAAFLYRALDLDLDASSDGRLFFTDPRPGADLDSLGEVADLLERHGKELEDLLAELRPSEDAPVAENSAQAMARLQSGLQHLQNHEEDHAIAELSAALRLNPELIAALLHRGEAYRRKGSYERALVDYDTALRLEPRSSRILFNRGMTHWLLGRLDDALADYTASLEADPANALTWIQRGIVHTDKGDHDAAQADFTRAIQLDATALAYQKRGDLFFRMGQYDQAIADYTQVFLLDPFSPHTYVRRGEAYRLKGKLEQAAADFGSALKLDPLNLGAYLSRAAIYRQHGQHELALADLNQALQLQPGDGRIYHERALTFRDLKNYDAALADFDQAIRLCPENADMVYTRGCVLQLQGRFEEALEDFSAATHLNPHSAAAFLAKGSLHLRLEELDVAVANLSMALQLDPELAGAYVDRGTAWLRLGRLDLAIADCDQALQRNPRLASAYLTRAGAHLQQGTYEAAHEDCTHALEIEPENARAYHVRGMTDLKRCLYEEAVADFTESLRLNPSAARVLFLRSRAYQMLERHEDALEDLGQAVVHDKQYTAAYCSQRALVHTRKGEYRLALADYAIVLELDPTNLEALASRDEVLSLMASPPPAPVRPVSAKKADRPAGAASVAPRKPKTAQLRAAPSTQQIRLEKGTDSMPTLDAPLPRTGVTKRRVSRQAPVPPPAAEAPPAPESSPISPEDDAFLALSDQETKVAPALRGTSAPDAAVPPPQIESKEEEQPPGKGGPWQARVLKDQRDSEASERARLWAEMRHRERLSQTNDEDDVVSGGSGRSGPLGRRVFLFIVVGAVLTLLGGGIYLLLFANRDVRLTAEAAHSEFAANTEEANKKYKGKMVRLSGKVKVFKLGGATRYFLETPPEAKWGIELNLPAREAANLQDGQDITVRGRFATRKGEESNLMVGNCTVVK